MKKEFLTIGMIHGDRIGGWTDKNPDEVTSERMAETIRRGGFFILTLNDCEYIIRLDEVAWMKREMHNVPSE